MNQLLNKKKFQIINRRNFIYIILLTTILLIFFFYQNLSGVKSELIKLVNNFSSNFNYKLDSLEVHGLETVEVHEIEKIVNPYLQESIFLLPLSDIAKTMKENPWINRVDLSTNFKNLLIVIIEEYKAIGLYEFNNEKYFFNIEGKIIDIENNTVNQKEDLITFSGSMSNKKAFSLIKIINKNTYFDNEKITNAIFVNQRRWNIILNNGIVLKLSDASTII